MPETITKQDVQGADQLFSPMCGLPVIIDFSDPANAYALSASLRYNNGVVNVECEPGFKWDGASIPVLVPLVPWFVTLLLMQFWPSANVLAVTAVFVAYTIRLLPYMQKMGLHARAGVVHDKLYRAQIRGVSRAVCDAILLEIMAFDRVPLDVRWLIYLSVRWWGWIPWRRNRKATAARAEAARDVEVVTNGHS